MKPDRTVSDYLQGWMEKNQFDLKQAAENLRVSYQTGRLWIRGTIIPRDSQLIQIATVLQVDETTLIKAAAEQRQWRQQQRDQCTALHQHRKLQQALSRAAQCLVQALSVFEDDESRPRATTHNNKISRRRNAG